MRTRTTILILFSISLLFATEASMAQGQVPIPTEKKKAIHKIDPVDIFPDARENTADKNKKKPAQNADSPTTTGTSATSATEIEVRRRADQGKSPSEAPSSSPSNVASATPTPQAAVVQATNQSSAPTSAPTPLQQTSSGGTPKSTPASTQAEMAMTQPSDQTGAGASASTSADQSARTSGMSLPVIFTLLGLILLVLSVLVVKLKNQLRTP